MNIFDIFADIFSKHPILFGSILLFSMVLIIFMSIKTIAENADF